MGLLDDIEFIQQGSSYEEQPSAEAGSVVTEASSEASSSESSRSNPFSRRKKNKESSGPKEPKTGKEKLKLVGIGAGVILTVILIGCSAYFLTKDKGPAWMQEVEEEGIPVFEYSMEEREMLRLNGFTGDDIERYEVEERDPYVLAEEAENARKAKYDAEIKPYLDGASEEFKTLKSLTWIGTGAMSSSVLNENSNYEERYGTYNCDYQKIPAYGSQLFLKLDLVDFNTDVFMSVTPKRYLSLNDTGNIVVVIEYNKYDDGSILVTGIKEKNIKE